ncbi:MAG: peptidoglycan bridge formation glycyltransferase FemA/FemB family protein [Clostridia bacterium]|nr:peptidoglycan bridge formation glycyltransferase FemA/FemB family protein [Clostridia bacterium]
MYRFNEEKDLAAFEQFVLDNGGIYMQSVKWAKVKQEWNSRYYSGFNGDGVRVLTALVMERRVPGAGKIWYSPAGAVCDYSDDALLEAFSSFMTAEMKKHGATALFFDPCVELRVEGERTALGPKVHKSLTACGFKLNPNASNCLYKSPVQLMLPLKTPEGEALTPEKLLKSFEKGVRYSVRIGENRGLTEAVYTIDDVEKDPSILEDFAAVMRDTSERNDFVERGSEYLKRLLSVFGPEEMDIMLIYYDKARDTAMQEERLRRKAELEAALPDAPEKKKRGMREEIESVDRQTEHYEERIRETAGDPREKICVAGGMTVHYNGMSSCLFGGARNLLRNNLRASHYFNFRRICRSIQLGGSVHDLGYVLLKDTPTDPDGCLGPCVPNEEFEGINAFKKSFGSLYTEYIGEYILIANKAKYFSYEHLIKTARSAQSVVNRIVRKTR